MERWLAIPKISAFFPSNRGILVLLSAWYPPGVPVNLTPIQGELVPSRGGSGDAVGGGACTALGGVGDWPDSPGACPTPPQGGASTPSPIHHIPRPY